MEKTEGRARIININKITQLRRKEHYIILLYSHNDYIVFIFVISVSQKWKPRFIDVKQFT